MLDYIFQFLLFLAKVIVVLGGIVFLLSVVSKLKHKVGLEQGDAEDPERATLIITDYAKLLERDRLKISEAACTEEQKKAMKKLLKAEEKAKAQRETEKMKAAIAAQKLASKKLATILDSENLEDAEHKTYAVKKEEDAPKTEEKSGIDDVRAVEGAQAIVQDATSKEAASAGANSASGVEESENSEKLDSKKSDKSDNLDNSDSFGKLGHVKVGHVKVGEADSPNLNISGGLHAFFILDFDGSVSGKEVMFLRRAVTLLVKVAEAGDEVLLRLKSPGGVVNGYGLCAAELERLRRAGLRLTIAVDEVAASGGYMMACVASRIIAAPFAYIGSIGVVAEFPNFNRVLKKYDVDYEQVTAGEYKRTMTTFGENTEEAREKFKEELKNIHRSFMAHVSKYRPDVDIEKVGTGEHWLAVDAIKLGLVDEIMTSDEYILNNLEKYDRMFKLEYRLRSKKNRGILPFVGSRLTNMVSAVVERFTGVKY